MASVEITTPSGSSTSSPSGEQRKPLHRIREVRLRQGVSLRSAARQTGKDIRTLRIQEHEYADLRLTDLQHWQKALDVPLTELLEDNEEPLSAPVLQRAHMVRLMKTAAAIVERSSSVAIQRMAQMMVDQLVEVMPELKEVSAWHSYGQRRSLDEYGRVVEKLVSSEDMNGSSRWEESA